MTGRRTLFIAAVLALIGSQLLLGADAALEKTVERAKEKRQQEIDKAGSTYHAAVDRANAALGKTYDLAIAGAKRKKDDAKVETLTKDQEALKAGGSPETAETGDKLLDGAIKRRGLDIEQAEKAFKSAVDRANTALEATYKTAIAGYKRKSDARGDELATEIAAIKAETVTPAKSEVAAESKGGNGNPELIKSIGDAVVTADGKTASSKALGGQEYLVLYFSAHW